MKKIFILVFFTINFAFGQLISPSKIPSRYNLNYIKLKSKIRKNITNQLEASFVKTHFMVGDSILFDLQLTFDEKGTLKKDKTIVYTNSTVFNKKIKSFFGDFPQLSPKDFPFHYVAYDYDVLTKLEYVINSSYQLVEVKREDLLSRVLINIHPSEKSIIKYINKFYFDDWGLGSKSIKVPLNFTLNNDYSLSNLKVFNNSEFIKNKIINYITSVDNCSFYIGLKTDKNYAIKVVMVAHENIKSYEKNEIRYNNDIAVKFNNKSSNVIFPVFAFCHEYNLIDKWGTCFAYSFQKFIYDKINQDVINSINGNEPFKAKIKFIINTTGKITDVKISRVKKKLEKELHNVLNEFPKIEPGKKLSDNSPINMYFEFILEFPKKTHNH